MYLLRFIKYFLFVAAFLLPGQVYGGIYMYVDQDGVRHFTNVPTSKRYKPVNLTSLSNPQSNKIYTSNRKYRNRARATNTAQYDNHIKQAASRHMVDPLIIKAIIKAESDFDQYATSSKGAQGLMQLMPGTARDLRVSNPYNAAQNINGGTRYFKQLLDAYSGDIGLSLAAYNAGPGRVAKRGPLPRIKETRDYVRRVQQYYLAYQRTKSADKINKIKLQKLVTAN